MDPSLLDRLPEGPSGTVSDLYVPMVAEGERLQGVRLSGTWYDLSRPSLYRDAQLQLMPGRGRDRALLHPEARVSPSARVRRSVVGEGAWVGTEALVQRSILWEAATVEDGARVDGSIVVSGARVRADEQARGVVVLPERILKRDDQAGGHVERRDGMAWVDIA
jgi:NDP-sugar pyrophosphorylase family protein